jgi:hypothetical protein
MPATFPAPMATNPPITNKLYTVGSNVTGAGMGLVLGGSIFLLFAVIVPCDRSESTCDQSTWESKQDTADAFKYTGYGLMIAGGVTMLVGIPLWIIGYHQLKKKIRQESATLSVRPGGLSVAF